MRPILDPEEVEMYKPRRAKTGHGYVVALAMLVLLIVLFAKW